MDISTFLNPSEEAVVNTTDDLINHITNAFSEVQSQEEVEAKQAESEPIPIDHLLQYLDIVLRFEEDQGTGNGDLRDLLRQRIRTVSWDKIRALPSR